MTHKTIPNELKAICERLIENAKTKHNKIESIQYNYAEDTFKYKNHCFQLIGNVLFLWYNDNKKSTHIEKIVLTIIDN